MSDTYQAVYDAVRSRVSNGDIGAAVERAIENPNWSYYLGLAAQAAQDVANEHMRPVIVWRPRIFQDGGLWCALLGENIQVGVVGFGASPDEAAREFDKAWFLKIEDRPHA